MICSNCGSNVDTDKSIVCHVCGESLTDGNMFNESKQVLSLFEIGLRKRGELKSERKKYILTDNSLSKTFKCDKRTNTDPQILIEYENGKWYINSKDCRCVINRISINGRTVLSDKSFIKMCIDDVPIYAFKVEIRMNQEKTSICPYCGLNAVVNGVCKNCRKQVTL